MDGAVDPEKRTTPLEILQHTFLDVTGEKNQQSTCLSTEEEEKKEDIGISIGSLSTAVHDNSRGRSRHPAGQL